MGPPLRTTTANRRGSGRPAAHLAAAAALVPGLALGAAAVLTARARRAKPLHPDGVVGEGRFTITTPATEYGVPLLETTGTHRCVARWSRAMGLPHALPDIDGLALRLTDMEGADILLASTGTGPISRYVLRLRGLRRPGPVTTLLPVRTRGPDLLLAAVPRPGHRPPQGFDLLAASPRGSWRAVGHLKVVWSHADGALRFDPVRRPLPGTRQHAAFAVVREPAYLGARFATRADATWR